MARQQHTDTARNQRIKELYDDIEILNRYKVTSRSRAKVGFRLLIRLCYKAIDKLVEEKAQ